MSDIVIKAENLGKKYTIGHQVEKGNYTALRDVLMQNARTLWNKTKDLATGKPIIQGDILEEVWALKEVNFEIRRGEAVGIIGRNGAGKSTLLKILSRITEPSAGRVTIKGRVASLLEVGTGFHPELSGRENIYLNGTILGMTRAEIKKKFDEIVAFAEVEKYLDTPVKRYSSGMYVRLAFAVAAHLEPEILVVDEVLAVGDFQFQKKCLGKMGDISSKEGRTIIFVSHNMGAISEICNTVLMIENGQISFSGKTESVIQQYLNIKERKPFNEKSDLGDYCSRRGTGACRFSSIKVMNTDGEETFSFKKHATVEFYFEVIVYRDIENLLFFMHFESSVFPKGVAKTGIACTPYITVPDAPFVKNQRIRFKVIFKDFDLNPGEYPTFYWLGESIHSPSIDAVDKILPNLVVESEGITGLTSFITLKSELVMNMPDIIV